MASIHLREEVTMTHFIVLFLNSFVIFAGRRKKKGQIEKQNNHKPEQKREPVPMGLKDL